MTKREASLLITRAMTLICLVGARGDLTFLPADVIALMNYSRRQDAPATAALSTLYRYCMRYYISWIAGRIFSAVSFLHLAGALYRGGPKIARFFLPEDASALP